MIKDNKIEPQMHPRNMVPAYAIVGMGLAALAASIPEFMDLPIQVKAVLAGIVILLAISYEIHRSQLNSAYQEALAKFNQGIPPNPLPKKFALKLTAELQATPSEFADAIAEETQRPQWELKLKQIKKKAYSKMEIEYIGTAAPHEISYDFEIMAAQSGSPLTSFLVNELTVMNKGLKKSTSIYLLEEIANRPGVLRVTQFC